MIIGNRNFDTDNNTYVMGILNVTPDSFSDGSRFNDRDKALRQAQLMISQGADIIDIGGESTRPGYTKISDEEEIERVSDIIRDIKANFDIPISLDTYKSRVAKAGIALGVDLINDIWGLKYDKDMGNVIAQSGVSCCLMHNKEEAVYSDFVEDVKNELLESVSIALEAGIKKDRICLDPGVGFAKSYEENLMAIKHLDAFNNLGYPVLLGTSRKSVIGLTLNLDAANRLEGTIATSVWAVMNNISFVRVHDVESNVRAIKMAMAIRDIKIDMAD